MIHHAIDWTAVAIAAAALAGWLPPIAALMSILWLGVQLYDRFKRKL
jgi:hypothetical protein